MNRQECSWVGSALETTSQIARATVRRDGDASSIVHQDLGRPKYGEETPKVTMYTLLDTACFHDGKDSVMTSDDRVGAFAQPAHLGGNTPLPKSVDVFHNNAQ